MEISRGPSPVGGGSAVSPSGFAPLAFSSRHAHDGGGGGGGGRDSGTSTTTRPNLDISALKKQYARLRERQKQAHIILTGQDTPTCTWNIKKNTVAVNGGKEWVGAGRDGVWYSFGVK